MHRTSRLPVGSIVSAALALLLVGACSKKAAPAEGSAPYSAIPEEKFKGVARTRFDSPDPTKAQLERRKRSIAIVQGMGLPWLEGLPVVEDEASITPRTSEEVARRCLATVFCAIKGESNDRELVARLVESFGAKGFFSPAEQRFLADPSPSKQDLSNFSWRYECAHVFLWALGYLPALNPPNRVADVASDVKIVKDKGPQGFARDAKLRPLSEILDQNDLYYRLDWAAVDLRIKGKTSERANEEIIVERHRALNWLVRYMNQAWDDVTTDT